MSVYDEIQAEREQQDQQWGGRQHDSGHGPWDWEEFTQKFLYRAAFGRGDHIAGRNHLANKHWRRRMLQVAALAVAAIEWYDDLYTPDQPMYFDGVQAAEREYYDRHANQESDRPEAP